MRQFPLTSYFGKKSSLILYVNELILFVDFKTEDRLSIFLAPYRTGTFGQRYFRKMESLIQA